MIYRSTGTGVPTEAHPIFPDLNLEDIDLSMGPGPDEQFVCRREREPALLSAYDVDAAPHTGLGLATESAPRATLSYSMIGHWAAKGAALSMATTGALIGVADNTAAEREIPYYSASTPIVERSVAAAQFEAALSTTPPKIDAARALIPAISAGNPNIGDVTERAISAAAASYALNLSTKAASKPFGPNTPTTVGITDPAILAATTNAIYVINSRGVLQRVEGRDTGYSTSQARADITQNMPQGSEESRDNALKAIDDITGEQLAQDFSLSDNEDKAREGLSNVQNPDIRAKTVYAIDLRDASEALLDLSYGQYTADQARADIANIADPAVRKTALAAINAHEHGDEYAASDAGYELSNQACEAKEPLGYDSSDFRDDVVAAQGLNNIYSNLMWKSFSDTENILGEEAKATNHVTAKPAELPTTYTNPDETLDLNSVRSHYVVPNSYKKTGPTERASHEPTTYQQFGEVHAKDGDLVFDLRSNMSPKLRQQLKAGFDQVEPFVRAGFASGQIVSVHFVAGETFNPYYLPATREVYMVLPKNDSVTVDKYVAAFKHEVLHGISLYALDDSYQDPAMQERFINACNNLKASAYDDLESVLRSQPTILSGLRAAAKPEHQALIDKLINAVNGRTLTETLKSTPKELSRDSITQNECSNVPLSSLLIDKLRARDGDIRATDLEYLYRTDAFAFFNSQWVQVIEYDSAYNSTINESSYVTSSDPDANLLGHSESNRREVYASILDAALTWPDKFSANLKKLDSTERQAVLDMLDACARYMMTQESLFNVGLQLRVRYALAA
ncbi:MAG TPA: hypothetical protein VF809_02175 [Candidatus Saccharimonadales bacterium]